MTTSQILFRGAGFQFNIPQSWLVQAMNGFQAVIVEPTEATPPATLTVTVRSIQPDVTPQAVAHNVDEEQSRLYGQYHRLESIDLSAQGVDAAGLIMQWQDPDMTQPVKQFQYFWRADDTLYTLTATEHPQTSADSQQALKDMLNSFQITRA